MVTELTRTTAPSYGIAMLDVYAGGEVVEPERIEAIATISAGSKEPGKMNPTRSKDGTIVLHDDNNRAPGLRAALEATNFKSLTIAFPMDDPSLFVQQRFTRYSASALEVYGDTQSLTEIKGKTRTVYEAGSKGYAELVKTCKVSVSVYFALAGMVDGIPTVEFPDGFGCYRLRFTSRNSLRSLNSAIVSVQRATQGHIAGIPFELSIDYREATDPDGQRRTVPVWTFLPFKGLRLTSDTFRKITSQAINAGSALLLPAPAHETIDYAVADMPVDDEAIDQLQHGGTCNKAHYCKAFFAAVKDTEFDNDEGRANLVSVWTSHATDSLSTYLKTATEAEASAFIEWVRASVTRDDDQPVTHTTTVVHETGEIVATIAETAPEDAPPAGLPESVDILRRLIHTMSKDTYHSNSIPLIQSDEVKHNAITQIQTYAGSALKALAVASIVVQRQLKNFGQLSYAEASALVYWSRPANSVKAKADIDAILAAKWEGD